MPLEFREDWLDAGEFIVTIPPELMEWLDSQEEIIKSSSQNRFQKTDF